MSVTITTTMVEIDCGECGITFLVPEWWRQKRRDDGKTFWCPNGHRRVYRESTIDKLQAQLDQAKADANWQRRQREYEQRSHSATKGQLTKARKRAANGVCPCCNRSFVNVARHVSTQHPDFTP